MSKTPILTLDLNRAQVARDKGLKRIAEFAAWPKLAVKEGQEDQVSPGAL